MNTEEKLNSIKVIFEALGPREKLILFARHILGMSYGSMGKEFGVSRQRIKQIRERGLRKIRKAVEKNRLVATNFSYIQMPDRKKSLEDSIEELGLSVLPLRALKSSGIKKVGDLVGKTVKELLVMRQVAEKSVQRIESQLQEYDLVERRDEDGHIHFERRR